MENLLQVLLFIGVLVVVMTPSVGTSSAETPNVGSSAFCLPAIFKGLQVANPNNDNWLTANDEQREFMTAYNLGANADLPLLQDKVAAIATGNQAEINTWFAQHGFPDMKISIPSNGKAVGTVFDLLVDWKVPGRKMSFALRSNNGASLDWYQGVKMSASEGNFVGYKLEGYDYPLLQLDVSQEGWRVYLIEVEVADGDNPKPSDLPICAKGLLARNRTKVDYGDIIFPAVEMATDVDIKWIEGMRVPNFNIDEAVKKVRLRLDDKGARAQSAVAYISKGIKFSPSYSITRPFYVIFTKDGLNFPAFVAISATDTWIKEKQ